MYKIFTFCFTSSTRRWCHIISISCSCLSIFLFSNICIFCISLRSFSSSLVLIMPFALKNYKHHINFPNFERVKGLRMKTLKITKFEAMIGLVVEQNGFGSTTTKLYPFNFVQYQTKSLTFSLSPILSSTLLIFHSQSLANAP